MSMHWADQTAKRIIKEQGDKEEYTVEAGISPSGVIHIGNFREVITHDMIARALVRMGKKVRYLYVWDDFDPFRKIPKDAPKQDVLKDNLRRPICKVPDVFGKEKSYARRNEIAMENVLPITGIEPTYIYQHERYKGCEYAEETKTALDKKEEIRDILDKFRTEPLPVDWLPISIYCPKCWKDTTKPNDYDGKYSVSYECKCGNSGTIDLRKDGVYKLPWRIDWAMRWKYEDVDFESAGKEHGTVGGSFDTGDLIVEEVYGRKPPTHFTYNFIRLKGGPGKMSSSAGEVVTLADLLKVYTPELARYIFTGSRPQSEFAISFETELLQLYEEFDTIERIYFGAEKRGEKETENAKRIYELSMPFPDKIPKKLPLQPGIRHLTNLVQIFPEDIERVKEYFKAKTGFDEQRLMKRAECALNWVKSYAPESFRFKVQREVPIDIKNELSGGEKKALNLLAERLGKKYEEDELFNEFYSICEETGIKNKQFFKAAYRVLIGKEKGPRLATLILEIGQEDTRKILEQV